MEWIKCSDRMPTDGIDVIVYRGGKNLRQDQRIRIDWRELGSWGNADVTHWQPLPAPPQP